MLDNRWPHLCPVDAIPGMDAVERSRLRRTGERLKARTDFNCAFNKVTGCLHFYLGTPEFGAAVPSFLSRVMQRKGVSRPMNDDRFEELVKALQRGRASRFTKDRANRFAETAEKSAVEQAGLKKKGEVEKSVEQKLRRTLNRRGMSSKFRPSAVVDGLKGSTR